MADRITIKQTPTHVAHYLGDTEDDGMDYIPNPTGQSLNPNPTLRYCKTYRGCTGHPHDTADTCTQPAAY